MLLTCRRRSALVLTPFAVLALMAGLSGCGDAARARTASEVPGSHSPTARPTPVPCDPGGGAPTPVQTCPDATPLIGTLSSYSPGQVVVQPVHVYGDDSEGRAYAQAHGLEFPFPDDYYQAVEGQPRSVTLTSATACTGIMVVGYREPLHDHVVPCEAFGEQQVQGVTVAVWRDGDQAVQLSELFRP